LKLCAKKDSLEARNVVNVKMGISEIHVTLLAFLGEIAEQAEADACNRLSVNAWTTLLAMIVNSAS
jgi:hypothetical protein